MTRKITSPVTSTLKASGQFVDNSLSESLRRLRFLSILKQVKLTKTCGAAPSDILYLILLAPIVKVQSTWAFCSSFLQHWHVGEKDVIYRFLRREDISWARIQIKLAVALSHAHLAKVRREDCAIVVDSSKKHRSGKVEGACQLFDHVAGKVVRCQEVIAIGLASPKGYIPLANHFRIGRKRVYHREQGFKDERKEVAKAYRRAIEGGPHVILKAMIKRVLQAGIKAKWLIGDSGYSQKANIALALDNGLEALFLMKRNRMVYRVGGRLLNAKEIYRLFRRQMRPAADGKFRSYAFKAELNLHGPGESPRWVTVQLMLSRPTRNRNRNGWVLSLCTDLEVSVDRMIELYLMRWSIEIFFKECKQHLGWLNNQSKDFISSYASMHLSSIRYLLLLDAALSCRDGERGLVANRHELCDQLTEICYLGTLWQYFIALVFGWLDELKDLLSVEQLAKIRAHLGAKVDEFIDLAFQIDLETAPNPAIE